MKGIVYRRYGSPEVLEYEELEKPVPADDEVLIRVRAASVNPSDRHLMRGRPYILRLVLGLRKPRIGRPGNDVAGQVEAVGRNVTQFKPLDAVFGSCRGAFAEYACASESKLTIKPEHVTFEQAASAGIAAFTALQGLRDHGQIQPKQKVLVNGAAGGVGTFAIQIAKSFGAEVTGACSSENVDFVRSIGADHVIDYTREDFTRGGQRYDLILDCYANHSLLACRRALKANGKYIVVGGPIPSIVVLLAGWIGALVLSRLVSQKFVIFVASLNKEDRTIIRDLLETRKVTPVIGRRYRLSEVADAIRYVGEGHARGKVVITFEQDNSDERNSHV